MKEVKKAIRCAIYTRKSSEEGLEQDFNSLDAQREACEAYIKSQQHEGWVLIEKQYNDGGFSGGTLERPGVKELFKDIEAGEVDIVVVYKVDRLTRSLMDFSKIVELFDEQNASFVSITQHFNTTTSMGRLTLNILLSFAQFEREVTGERIRDKIAASKKKGMWMGGCTPLGYQKKDKKLIIEKESAETVKLIFDKYLECKSVMKLKEYLDANQIKTRTEKDFSKGQLYHMLANKVYIGKITHKDKVYEGEHEGIINIETFNKVQDILLENRVNKTCGIKSSSNSLLAGLIFDDKGNKMTPSHSNTRKRRYRYYVSSAVKKYNKKEAGSVSKIPAGEIEKFVVENIKKVLLDAKRIQKIVAEFDVNKQKAFLKTAKSIDDFSNPKLIRSILSKVVISKNNVEITLCEKAIEKTLEKITNGETLSCQPDEKEIIQLVISKKIKLSQPSKTGNILILNANDNDTPTPNPYLVNAIVKSHYYHKLLQEGTVKDIVELQKMEGLKDTKYIRNILNLKFLSPSLTEQILNGTQPKNITLKDLCKI